MSSGGNRPRRRWLSGALAAGALLLALAGPVAGHSELVTTAPAAGSQVASPFSGPIVLTFSEHLADGSKAELYDSGHQLLSSAEVDAAGPTMTFTLVGALGPGDYEVEWTSIADDGDLLRGTVKFSVIPTAASPTPSAPSAATSSIEPSAETPSAASASATAETATPSPSPSPAGGDTSGTGGDVILPIVVVLIAAAAGAFYLVRRNRPA